jgi:hypothetical protein
MSERIRVKYRMQSSYNISQVCCKNNQGIANSHSLSVKNGVSQEQEQTHQTVQSEQLNTAVVSREVEVLLLAQRKGVRL